MKDIKPSVRGYYDARFYDARYYDVKNDAGTPVMKDIKPSLHENTPFVLKITDLILKR